MGAAPESERGRGGLSFPVPAAPERCVLQGVAKARAASRRDHAWRSRSIDLSRAYPGRDRHARDPPEARADAEAVFPALSHPAGDAAGLGAGGRMPDAPARALIKAIREEPAAVRRALARPVAPGGVFPLDYFAGRRMLARSVPTTMFPVKPLASTALR
jgi:hypothetical protein